MISHGNMKEIQGALEKLDKNFTKGETKKIRLVGSKLTIPEFEAILEALVQHPTLRSLEVCICDVPLPAIIEFGKRLPDTNLVLLQLVKVGLTDESAAAIADGIREYANRNRIRSTSDSEAASAAGTRHLCGIKKLDLTFNNLGPLSAKNFASIFKYTNIESLLLGRNQIGDEGCFYLAEGIMNGGKRLKWLDLRLNSITDIGVSYLARALGSLIMLQLDSNNITHESIVALCETLPGSKIEILSIGANNLADNSIVLIADVLSKTNIKQMMLSGNKFGDVGGLKLATELSGNFRIESLDIRGSLVTDRTANAILQAILTHRSVKKISLEETTVDPELITAIFVKLSALHTGKSKILTALCSAKLKNKSHFSIFKYFPTDLIRSIAEMLG